MDPEGRRFGRGPRELGGAVDLINRFKLWPHHEFFCKRPLPLSISKTHYLQNVVGETEIRKGEGMELDQLSQNIPYHREKTADIHAFDLHVLREAFHMRETTPVYVPSAEKWNSAGVMKSNFNSRDKERKHKTHKDRDKKDKNHKKHKHNHKDESGDKEKSRNKHHESKHQDKKRKHEGKGDLPDIHKHQKIQNTKIATTGKLKVKR